MGSHLLGWLAVLCYAGAEAAAIFSLVAPRPRLAAVTPALVAAGLVLHFRDLILRARALGSVPYSTLGGSVSLFGWMLGFAFLVLLLRHRERSLGPFLIPFILIATVAGMLLPEHGSAPAAETRGSLFALHVTLGILAYAAFTFSFVLSLLYLIQDRQLRRRQTGLLFSRLPALEVIGRMNRTSVTIGLSSLAASLAIGVARASVFWTTLADPKIAWALVTAVVYGFLLWKERRGWEGPRVAILSILGFGIVMFSYTIVNVYLSRAHRFP